LQRPSLDAATAAGTALYSATPGSFWIKESIMKTASPDRLAKGPTGTQSPQEIERRDRRKAAGVSWYGRLLIFSMLLVAAGWEFFRLILAAIISD
jgi:hypothetical protein